MADLQAIHRRFMAVRDAIDERARRPVAAAESLAIGRGGIAAVAQATGMSRQVIRQGMVELRAPAQQTASRSGRIRRPGGGRKKTVDVDQTLLQHLEELVDPATRGDPESPLRWTCKSVRKLAMALKQKGHRTSHRMVAILLQQMGYSLQSNRKTREGGQHPDRNAQFEHINRKVKAAGAVWTTSSSNG